jgi:hypothetical protein
MVLWILQGINPLIRSEPSLSSRVWKPHHVHPQRCALLTSEAFLNPIKLTVKINHHCFFFLFFFPFSPNFFFFFLWGRVSLWSPGWPWTQNRSIVLAFFFFFCSTGVWTQGFMLARQLFYCLSHSTSFKILLPQPPEFRDYRCVSPLLVSLLILYVYLDLRYLCNIF